MDLSSFAFTSLQ